MHTKVLLIPLAMIAIVGAACSSSSPSSATSPQVRPTRHRSSQRPSSSESAIPPESPVPAESNPPGDIPDNTQFIPYRSSSGHFAVKVPEGWARKTRRTRRGCANWVAGRKRFRWSAV